MPRYHIQETVTDTNGTPLDTATVTVCVLGTTEASRVSLYADANSATTLANPLTSDGSGLVDFYLAYPLVCDLRPVKNGVAGRMVTVRPGLPAVGDVPTWDGAQDVHQKAATAPYWISGRIHQHYASGTTGSKVQITPLTDQVAQASAGWTASGAGDLIPPQAGLYTVDWAATIESNAGQLVKVFAEDSDTSTVNVDASAAWRVPDAQGDGTGVTWSSTWAGATPTDSIGLAIEMAALSGATSGDVDVYVVLRLRYVGPLA